MSAKDTMDHRRIVFGLRRKIRSVEHTIDRYKEMGVHPVTIEMAKDIRTGLFQVLLSYQLLTFRRG